MCMTNCGYAKCESVFWEKYIELCKGSGEGKYAEVLLQIITGWSGKSHWKMTFKSKLFRTEGISHIDFSTQREQAE